MVLQFLHCHLTVRTVLGLIQDWHEDTGKNRETMQTPKMCMLVKWWL